MIQREGIKTVCEQQGALLRLFLSMLAMSSSTQTSVCSYSSLRHNILFTCVLPLHHPFD